MPAFERKTRHMVINGIDLNNPIDLMPPEKWPILENVRSFQVGRLESRAGMKAINPGAMADLNVHSAKRLNDPLPSAPQPYTRFYGAGTSLYAGTNGPFAIDAGYSGNPLSFVDWRPEQSPEPWCYVYDSLRMRKVRVDGLDYQIGIVAPNTAPVVELSGAPYWYNVDNGTQGSYVNGGNAGSISTPTRVPASTTIGTIVYDSGSVGWCTIAPSNSGTDYSFLGEMISLVLGGSETVLTVEIRPKLAQTTVAAISYDSGSTGICTIQPSGSWTGLQRDGLVIFSGTGSGSARILSVTQAPDGSYSFRCSTSGTIPAGATMDFPATFRTYTNATFAATNTITGVTVTSTLSSDGIGTITRTANFDLSTLSGRATQPDDYIHLSIKISALENVVSGKLMYDVDSTTNDFTKNYYYKAFRPNDFVPVTVNDLTTEAARQVAIQRQITDGTTGGTVPFLTPNTPDPSLTGSTNLTTANSEQTTTGASQWTELIFRFSDLVRVGADSSRTLANVKAWRFQLEVSDTTTVAITAQLYAGTYGPDQGPDSNEVLYRYRYRSSLTGARSTPGPATRNGVLPRRGLVSVTTLASADPQVDQIDIERFGGALSDWHYVGTIPNGTGPFYDTFDALAIAQNDPLEIGGLLPFPSIDIPRSSTVTVIGTTVLRTGGTDTFNTSWAPGTPIKINGIIYTLYGQPTSTTRLEIVESANQGTGLSLIIDEPVILGNNLPCVWGPFNGFGMGAGDTRQPGTLRFTRGNDLDSAPEHYFLELTSPSDPLQNGVLYDGRSLCVSTLKWFDIRPTQDIDQPFTAQELPIDRGLLAPWAISVGGGRVWFLSDDGIYWTTGGPATSITEKDLRPLFPHGDEVPAAVNGFNPPDLTQLSKLRLSWVDSWLYFDYQDTAGNLRTLAYDTVLDSWWPDAFNPGVNFHYADEAPGVYTLLLLANDGRAYSYEGYGDGATSTTDITCHARTQSDNLDDLRTRKLFGDLYMDADTQQIPVTITPGFDNYTSLLAPFVYATSTRAEAPIDLLSGLGKLATDIALDFSWASHIARPYIYNWALTVVNKPELSKKRATDWDDAGTPGSKYIRAMLIEADTLGLTRTVTVLKDGGADSGVSLAVNHNGQETKPYSITPFTSHLMRCYPTDENQWQLFQVTYIYDLYPESLTIWKSLPTAHGLHGFLIIGWVYVALMSQGDTYLEIVNEAGVSVTFRVPNTNSVWRKVYFTEMPIVSGTWPLKGRAFTYNLTGGPFNLFAKDCEVAIKPWGSQDSFAIFPSFSDVSRMIGPQA